MKVSNYTLLLNVLIGYILYFAAIIINKVYGLYLVPIIIVAAYYSILSMLYNKKKLLSFLVATFILLSTYLTFIYSETINWAGILKVYNTKSLAISLFTNVLLPMVFLSYTVDFFQFTKEITSIRRLSIFHYLIPVLIKRELILKRHNNLVNRLQSRGVSTENSLIRFFRMKLWIIPLITTTLIEGVESYEYNLMLNADILKYKNSYKLLTYRSMQTFILLVLSLMLGLIIVSIVI